MKYFNIFLFLVITFMFQLQNQEKIIYNYMISPSLVFSIPKIENNEIDDNNKQISDVIETFYGTVTAYDPNCSGCIGITASGYDVRNTIYYDDNQYGAIRIIAASNTIPFGSIIKLSDVNGYDDIITIVLDRGSAIGFNTNAQADLLFYNENDAYDFGRKYDVKFEILRLGF